MITPHVHVLFVEPGHPVAIRLCGLLPDLVSVLVRVEPDLRVSVLREHRGPEPSVDQRANARKEPGA